MSQLHLGRQLWNPHCLLHITCALHALLSVVLLRPATPLTVYQHSSRIPCEDLGLVSPALEPYRGQICTRRLLGFGATPCRLVSLIHTCVGPYDRARDVRNASDMKVNRMSLALAALGQRAAMASELAGFGRNFRAGMHSMVTETLAFKSWRL